MRKIVSGLATAVVAFGSLGMAAPALANPVSLPHSPVKVELTIHHSGGIAAFVSMHEVAVDENGAWEALGDFGHLTESQNAELQMLATSDTLANEWASEIASVQAPMNCHATHGAMTSFALTVGTKTLNATICGGGTEELNDPSQPAFSSIVSLLHRTTR